MNASITISSGQNSRLKISVLTIFFASLIVLAGCAENYGRLQRSAEIDKIFK